MATRREQAIAESNARAAEAAARAAEAQTRATEAKLSAEAVKRKSDTAVRDAAISAGINVGMPLAGMYAGAKLAKKISNDHGRHIAAKNKELAGLASNTLRVMRGAVPKNMTVNAALAGSVAAADKLKLGRAIGPLGMGYAGLLIAEGAMSRFVVAPSVKDDTTREVVNAVATSSAFAASTLIGKRMIDNATTKAIPNAANLAVIDAARAKLMATVSGTKALAAASAAAKPALSAGRLALRALPVIGNVAMAAGAGLGAYRAYKEGGTARDIAVSAMRGTIGLGHTVAQAAGNRIASTRGALARAGAARVAASQGSPAMRAARAVAAKPSSDGMTSGYTRQQGGKSITVKGYKTPR